MSAVGQTDPMPGDVVFFYHTSGGAGSAQNIVSRNVYSDMRGRCWSGTAIYGFARIQTSGQSLVDMVKTFGVG